MTAPASPDSSKASRNGLHDVKSDEISPTSHEDGSGNEASAAKPQRSRACVSCRAMKIKCRWPENQDACVACAKVNRDCVMPGPPKKRQKNKHKFAELEQKINALTEALIAKENPASTPSNDASITKSVAEPYAEPAQTDKTGTHGESICLSTLPGGQATGGILTAQWREAGGDKPIDFSSRSVKVEDYVDIVNQGKVDLSNACKMFDHWQANIQPYFPLVVLPSHVKAEDVRIARPMLFLAVLAVASPTIQPDMQPEILYEFNREVSQRVLFYGEKSLDLVQAMLVYVKNYTRPRYAKDLIFNQYIHCAAVMCLDLGIGKKLTLGSVQNPVEEAEIRRTWVGTYHVGSSSSILLRHPMLVRFSPYVEECIQFLLTSPYAAASDKWLCSLCRLQHIAEDVSVTFGADEQILSSTFSDPKTLHHLKAFEQQLQSWMQTVPENTDKRLVNHLRSACNLYIHEIAIQQGQSIIDQYSKLGEFPPGKQSYSQRVTAAHIDALSACLSSCHKVLESWLALDIQVTRSVPNLYIVWNVYAAVSLIKIHGIIYAPDSDLVNVFAPDLRVEYYLTAVANKLAETAQGGHCPTADGFGFIFRKLMSWFSQRKGPAPSVQLFSSIEASQTTKTEQDPAMAGIEKSLAQKLEIPQHYSAAPGVAPPPVGTTTDLNAAFSASNYNINWNELNFSADELNAFDEYMNDPGWLGYLM